MDPTFATETRHSISAANASRGNADLAGLVAISRVVIVALLATGCTFAPRPGAMVPSPERIPRAVAGDRYAGRVRIDGVDGGAESSPCSGPNVSNNQFRTALEGALRESGYLSTDSTRGSAALRIRIVSLENPGFGFTYSVGSVVHYSVIDSAGAVLLDTDVLARAQKSFRDAFVGAQRRRLANEASIRANIEAFLLQLRAALERRP